MLGAFESLSVDKECCSDWSGGQWCSWPWNASRGDSAMPPEANNRRARTKVARRLKERPRIPWTLRPVVSISAREPMDCAPDCCTRKKWTWALAMGSKVGQCLCDWVAVADWESASWVPRAEPTPARSAESGGVTVPGNLASRPTVPVNNLLPLVVHANMKEDRLVVY